MIVPLDAKKNTALVFYVAMDQPISGVVQGHGAQFQIAPTLAAGDARISIDGGSFSNLATLPVVTPPADKIVKISLSAAEMNGDDITVLLSDQTSPCEWCDILIKIKTFARTNDDFAYPGYTVLDAVCADGQRPTIEQALYMIHQVLMERQVSGTAVLIKKPDGTTTLATLALDNAATPHSYTRDG